MSPDIPSVGFSRRGIGTPARLRGPERPTAPRSAAERAEAGVSWAACGRTPQVELPGPGASPCRDGARPSQSLIHGAWAWRGGSTPSEGSLLRGRRCRDGARACLFGASSAFAPGCGLKASPQGFSIQSAVNAGLKTWADRDSASASSSSRVLRTLRQVTPRRTPDRRAGRPWYESCCCRNERSLKRFQPHARDERFPETREVARLDAISRLARGEAQWEADDACIKRWSRMEEQEC